MPRSHPAERSERIVLEGEVADPANPPPGCHFAPRCRYALPECTSAYRHVLNEITSGHEVGCLRAAELRLAGVRE